MSSPSVSPTCTMVDWTDSFYNYVKNRILGINPTRVFSGIVEASDWPSSEAVPNSFYLVIGNNDPNRSNTPGENSWSSPLYSEVIQWAWPIIGEDIPQNGLQLNRADRYRKNFVMVQEILHGMFPGFCEKLQYSVDDSAQLLAVSYVPKEMIWFTKPRFVTKIDRSSGILFGSASANITSFSPTIVS